MSASPASPPSWKAECSNHTLTALLKKLVPVVEDSQTLPVLGCVRFDVEGSEVHLQTSDSMISLRGGFRMQGDAPKPLSFGVPARKLYDVCRSLSDAATLQLNYEEGWLELKSGACRMKLATLGVEDYPQIELAPWEASWTMEAESLRLLLQRIQMCMGQRDARTYLNGAHWQLKDGRLVVMATDGHRLAEGAVSVDTEATLGVILPRKAVLEVVRLLGGMDAGATVALNVNGRHLSLEAEGVSFVTNLLEGQYPDCSLLFPHVDSCMTVVLSRDEFAEMLKRASVLVHEKFNGIRLTFSSGRMACMAYNAHHERANDDMAVSYTDEIGEMAFNVVYLLDLANTLSEACWHMHFKEDQSALMLESQDEDRCLSWRYLVMALVV